MDRSERPELEVSYSVSAARTLVGIWRRNVKTYGSRQHADEYIDFLKAGIAALGKNYEDGKVVEAKPASATWP